MKNVIRVENGSIINGQGGSGGSGGHTIQNDSGTALPQESALQFVGVYSEDDSTNGKTKVNIIREMTKAQMDALSTDAKKGVIHTTDEADNPANPISAEDVTYESGTVKDALDNVPTEILSQLSNKMGTLKIQPITVGPSMTNNIPFKRCALLYFGRLSDHYLYTVSYEGRTKAVVAEGTFVSSISGDSSNIAITTTGGYDHFGFIITSEI